MSGRPWIINDLIYKAPEQLNDKQIELRDAWAILQQETAALKEDLEVCVRALDTVAINSPKDSYIHEISTKALAKLKTRKG